MAVHDPTIASPALAPKRAHLSHRVVLVGVTLVDRRALAGASVGVRQLRIDRRLERHCQQRRVLHVRRRELSGAHEPAGTNRVPSPFAVVLRIRLLGAGDLCASVQIADLRRSLGGTIEHRADVGQRSELRSVRRGNGDIRDTFFTVASRLREGRVIAARAACAQGGGRRQERDHIGEPAEGLDTRHATGAYICPPRWPSFRRPPLSPAAARSRAPGPIERPVRRARDRPNARPLRRSDRAPRTPARGSLPPFGSRPDRR